MLNDTAVALVRSYANQGKTLNWINKTLIAEGYIDNPISYQVFRSIMKGKTYAWVPTVDVATPPVVNTPTAKPDQKPNVTPEIKALMSGLIQMALKYNSTPRKLVNRWTELLDEAGIE